MRARVRRRAVSVVAVTVVSVVGCGLDVVGATRPSALESDVTGASAGDAPAGDAPGAIARVLPEVFRCGDASVTDCLACTSGHFLCRETATCVSACATSCSRKPVECLGCGAEGRPAVAVCESPDDANACIAAPLQRCMCTTMRDCPGPRQVCSPAGTCLGCGEPGSDKRECSAGKHCAEDKVGNPNEEFRCR